MRENIFPGTPLAAGLSVFKHPPHSGHKKCRTLSSPACSEAMQQSVTFLLALGERAEDLKSFIDYYLGSANKKYSRSVEFTPRAMGCLLGYDWKENIDEVHMTIERIVLTTEKKKVDVFDLPDRITGGSSEVFAQNASLKDMLEFYESGLVMRAYEKYRTSVAVAQKLGISQATAVRKIHKYAGRDVE